MKEHLFPLKVYFEDTDSIGVVYHGNYVKYFERGRTEMLTEVGFPLSRIKEEFNVQFVIREINIKYHKPAYLDQELMVVSKITNLGRAKLTFHQTVYSNWYEEKITLTSAIVELVCVNLQNKVAKLPDIVIKELNCAS